MTMLDLLQQPKARPGSAGKAFLAAALRNPSVIGGIGPTGSRLARRLASVVPSGGELAVVELGPGTGPVSRAVRERLNGNGQHIAVEVDERMVRYLQSVLPDLDVAHADAAQLPTLLAERGLDSADAVVSTLPWSNFAEPTQRSLLEVIAGSLAEDGVFTTMACYNTLAQPSARRFRRLLGETFEEVITTRVIWRNWPPALSYVCRRPIG
ncbi:class I SAM-dependent methyltransferase [Sciscionella sediminilitoris]|uniref:class I SAM-dependent methyltransferase n=1 Tax=Sciscionella sediminilitoris TaxID=1445613 RepID=UPI0004DF707D|nr:methyltransferase domain-containing protein [Sciscionella sp. SE31]